MNKAFYKKIGLSRDELLSLVRKEREAGEEYSYNFKLEIEADLKLLKNKRDKKKDEKLVGDSTMFNVHTALLARSFQSKNTINIKGDKNGIDREIKMLNAVLNEDNNTALSRALKYYRYYDKFACGISIEAMIGWDGIYKRPIFQLVNPLTWVPDPYGDYFTGNYKYTGFFSIQRVDALKEMYPNIDIDNLIRSYDNGGKDTKERMQKMQGLNPEYSKDVVDGYIHFTKIGDTWIYTKTANFDSILLEADFVKPLSPLEEKNEEAITPPFAFYYWKPDRDNCFGDRPANYTRDVQLQKAEIANLRLNKMRAELYPMYIYNKDYLSGKDLNFGFNKGIPVSTKNLGPVSLDSLVRPIQRDLRIDTSFSVEQSLDRQVEKSTSIGEVVQGTTTTRKETLGTNNLIQTNTDINLELNEEIHSIGEEQWIKLWFGSYYQNFADGDKKLIYAGSSTASTAIILKRKDFVYEGNLNISIESNISTEERRRKEAAANLQVSPLILPTLNGASKIKYLRYIADRAGIPTEIIEETLLYTPNMQQQLLENEALKENQFVPIIPEDNDEEHLVAMGDTINTEAFEIHKSLHLKALIAKATMKPIEEGPEGQISENSMVNSMASQAMAQAGSELK